MAISLKGNLEDMSYQKGKKGYTGNLPLHEDHSARHWLDHFANKFLFLLRGPVPPQATLEPAWKMGQVR